MNDRPKSMINTERLCLRPLRSIDAKALSKVLGDPEVMAFSDTGTMGPHDIADWVESRANRLEADHPSGTFAIYRKVSPSLLGYVSLVQTAGRTQECELELGVRLQRDAWGYGYAFEAATSLIQSAREMSLSMSVIAFVDPGNERSMRLVQRLGFAFSKEVMLPNYGHPDHLYRLSPSTA